MSRKRTANSGWESDEDDLLMNDGGISAFKTEDEVIDEEALLGLGDDDGGGDASYLQDHSGVDDGQDDFNQSEEVMLEIGVDEEEIQELEVEEDEDYTAQHSALAAEDDTEQLDYNDDLPQTDDVHIEYDEGAGDFEDTHLSQEEEAHDVSQSDTSVSYSHVESLRQSARTDESKESESESEDSDGEKHSRGRFKNERSNIISIGKVKSRTDIPDTLEVSAEQQAQLDQFPDNRRRDRGRGNRGGRGGFQRGGFRGGRNDRQMEMNRGAPMRHQGPHQPFPNNNQMGPPRPMMLMGQDIGPRQGGRMPHPMDRPGVMFGGQRPGMAGVMGPQPLMRMSQGDPGNRMQLLQGRGGRMMLAGQDARFNAVRGQVMMPGQGPHGGIPMQRQPQPQPQPPIFRPGNPVQAEPVRPHTIHINPNFRGPAASGPPSSVGSMGQPQPLFSQSSGGPGVRMQGMGGGDRPGMMQDSPRPLMSQSQGFGQPQGFQSRMGRPSQQSGLGPGHPQQSRFGGLQNQGAGQMMGNPPRHPSTPNAGFPGQRMPAQNQQQQFNRRFNNNNQAPPSQGMRGTGSPTTPRFQAPQQGVFRGPSPQQQLQQQHQSRFTARAHRRLGGQNQQAQGPQKVNAVTMAKKLTQQARITQQAKAATQSANQNIPVVSQKRRSVDDVGGSSPTKLIKKSEGNVPEEPCDDELRQGLEEQKRLREMIKKRKEEARRRQAEIRRKELEKRLAQQGQTLEDVEGGTLEEETTTLKAAPETTQPQRITTVVSQGGQKQLVTKRQLMQQRKQKLQQQQQYEGHQQYKTQQTTEQYPSQQYHQPQVFSSPPPPHQQQHHQPPPQQYQQHQQQARGPGMFSGQGFNQHFTQEQQQTFQPPPQQAVSPIRQPAPHFKPQQQQQQQQQPFQQQHHPQHGAQFPPPQPGGRQYQPTSGGNQFTQQGQYEVAQHLPEHFTSPPPPQQHGRDNAQHILGSASAPRGMAMGQVASVQGKAHPAGRGRGQIGVRGRGVGGQVTRSGRGVVLNTAHQQQQQRTMPSSAPSLQQQASNRTVLPVSRGRGIQQHTGAVSSPPVTPGRTVVQRQVVARPTNAVARTKQAGVPGSVGTIQKVAIDNISTGTPEATIRSICEACGPLMDVVMIESQQKAIVTFANKGQAVNFAKQWNRRPVNHAPIAVTFLP